MGPLLLSKTLVAIVVTMVLKKTAWIFPGNTTQPMIWDHITSMASLF